MLCTAVGARHREICDKDQRQPSHDQTTTQLALSHPNWPLQPVEGGPHQAPGAHISEALRIYEGHSNEKNFVGLAGELAGEAGRRWW